MGTITSANSEFSIENAAVFSGPQIIQGYEVEDAFGTEDVTPAVVKIGVDGKKSSGYTPYLTVMLVHLQADSPSIAIFEQWLGAMKAAKEDLPADSASIALPTLPKNFAFTNGSLSRAHVMPDAKKTLEGQTYQITWETSDPS